MKPSKVSDLIEKINSTVKKPGFPALAKIEYDLLMQHVRELYEELDILNSGKSSGARQNADDTKVGDEPETSALAAKRRFLSNENLLLKEVPVEKIEKVVASLKIEVDPGVKADILSPRLDTKMEKAGQQAVSINESVQSSESLNEKLKSSTGKEMHRKLASKPLKELIGLNQRFVLLNELFNGNAEAFTAAVNHIDSISDYAQADSFIQTQLISNYFWNESTQSVKLFMKLVKQKFGVE